MTVFAGKSAGSWGACWQLPRWKATPPPLPGGRWSPFYASPLPRSLHGRRQIACLWFTQINIWFWLRTCSMQRRPVQLYEFGKAIYQFTLRRSVNRNSPPGLMPNCLSLFKTASGQDYSLTHSLWPLSLLGLVSLEWILANQSPKIYHFFQTLTVICRETGHFGAKCVI
jgi:hypothetical protein